MNRHQNITIESTSEIIFYAIIMFICHIKYPDGKIIKLPPVERLYDLCETLDLSYQTIRHISCGYYKEETAKPRRIRHYLHSITIEKV